MAAAPKITILSKDMARATFPSTIKDRKLQEILPPNTEVVTELTPDMQDKIVYILPDPNSDKGIKCRIIEVEESKRFVSDTFGPYSNASVPSQKIVIEVISKSTIYPFSTIRDGTIHTYIKNGQVRLFIEPVQPNTSAANGSAAEAAQGGRRRKRARRTKRALSRSRRTHRKHRK